MSSYKVQTQPLVSILMPAYNAGKFIADAIESVLSQTYTNWELLVLDDGSGDDTVFIAKAFEDPRIKVFPEYANKGIVFQLNKGIDIATGSYLARFDSDDICLPRRIEVQVDFLETHPHIQVVGSQAEKVGDATGLMKYPLRPGHIDFLLNYYCCMLHPAIMMRSSLFENSSLRYKPVPYAEDYQLWIDISNGRNMANLPDVLIKYRIHKHQTNQLKMQEQYAGTMLARAHKLRKTFRFTSNDFQDRFNRYANDYIFYGKQLSVDKSPASPEIWDKLIYILHYVRGLRKKKPIVDFVRQQLNWIM